VWGTRFLENLADLYRNTKYSCSRRRHAEQREGSLLRERIETMRPCQALQEQGVGSAKVCRGGEGGLLEADGTEWEVFHQRKASV